MKKVIRLTESELTNIIKRVIKEEISEDKLNISNLINHLSDWNTDKKLRRERMKIYNRYKDGDITYEEYVKQRKELETKYNREDNK
jgi:hypothetical protein